MTSLLAASFDCQDYAELNSVDDAFLLWKDGIPSDWCFQLKYDGIWAKVVIDAGRACVYSKTGQLKTILTVPAWLIGRDQVILLGEYMFGSQWSQQGDRAGRLYIFDCLAIGSKDTSTIPYKQRKALADSLITDLGHPFYKVDSYTPTKLSDVWGVLEQTMKYEGIVVRNLTSTYFTKLYKLKTEVEDDYVLMNVLEGEGKLTGMAGALTVGYWNPTTYKYERVMEVGGGMTNEKRQEIWSHWTKSGHRLTMPGTDINQVGLPRAVVQVKGKSRFTSGALRHPQFVQFRDDKRPEDCKVKSN